MVVCWRWLKLLSSPSTSRKKPFGFFWRMRIAFSVVSTMDGSMLGSLSTSKRRSPGSNRAEGEGGGDRSNKEEPKIQYIHFISPQWRCSRKESPILPPVSLFWAHTQSTSWMMIEATVVHLRTITHHNEVTEFPDMIHPTLPSKQQ